MCVSEVFSPRRCHRFKSKKCRNSCVLRLQSTLLSRGEVFFEPPDIFQENVSGLLLYKLSFGRDTKILLGIFEFHKIRTSSRLAQPNSGKCDKKRVIACQRKDKKGVITKKQKHISLSALENFEKKILRSSVFLYGKKLFSNKKPRYFMNISPQTFFNDT